MLLLSNISLCNCFYFNLIFLHVWGKEKMELYSILRKVKNRGKVPFHFYFFLLHLTRATQSRNLYLEFCFQQPSTEISTAKLHTVCLLVHESTTGLSCLKANTVTEKANKQQQPNIWSFFTSCTSLRGSSFNCCFMLCKHLLK